MVCLLLDIQSFLAGYVSDDYEYIKEEEDEEDEDLNNNSKKKMGVNLSLLIYRSL